MNIEQEIFELKKRIEALEQMLSIKQPVEADQTAKRDKTRYMFENKIYPKNRLVLAIVKKYVENNNPTFGELQRVFDKSLQGSLNVVDTIENIEKIKDASKRYFLNDLITLKDKTQIAVCTQWGIFNIPKFVMQAKSLGFDIVTIQ